MHSTPSTLKCSSRRQRCWAAVVSAYVQVVLPNILGGILVSSLLAESIIFGDFVLANNIAGTNYQNIQVFLQANMDVSSGLSSAIVVVIFVVVALVTAFVLKLQNTASKKEVA